MGTIEDITGGTVEDNDTTGDITVTLDGIVDTTGDIVGDDFDDDD